MDQSLPIFSHHESTSSSSELSKPPAVAEDKKQRKSDFSSHSFRNNIKNLYASPEEEYFSSTSAPPTPSKVNEASPEGSSHHVIIHPFKNIFRHNCLNEREHLLSSFRTNRFKHSSSSGGKAFQNVPSTTTTRFGQNIGNTRLSTYLTSIRSSKESILPTKTIRASPRVPANASRKQIQQANKAVSQGFPPKFSLLSPVTFVVKEIDAAFKQELILASPIIAAEPKPISMFTIKRKSTTSNLMGANTITRSPVVPSSNASTVSAIGGLSLTAAQTHNPLNLATSCTSVSPSSFSTVQVGGCPAFADFVQEDYDLECALDGLVVFGKGYSEGELARNEEDFGQHLHLSATDAFESESLLSLHLAVNLNEQTASHQVDAFGDYIDEGISSFLGFSKPLRNVCSESELVSKSRTQEMFEDNFAIGAIDELSQPIRPSPIATESSTGATGIALKRKGCRSKNVDSVGSISTPTSFSSINESKTANLECLNTSLLSESVDTFPTTQEIDKALSHLSPLQLGELVTQLSELMTPGKENEIWSRESTTRSLQFQFDSSTINTPEAVRETLSKLSTCTAPSLPKSFGDALYDRPDRLSFAATSGNLSSTVNDGSFEFPTLELVL